MRRTRNPAIMAWALWLDTAQAAVATCVTVSARLSLMASGTITPRESRRMVTEKMEAVAEGAAAGAGQLLGRAGHRRSPGAASVIALLDATSKPARRRVKANARRLTGGKNGRR